MTAAPAPFSDAVASRIAATPAYASAAARFHRIGLIDEATAILDWDTATMMPTGAAEGRGEVLAELAVIRHELLCDPALADDVATALDREADLLAPWEHANLGAMDRVLRHARALPADLVAERSRVTQASEIAWRQARPRSDFAGYRPHLQAVLATVREIAAIKAEVLETTPYEALLDQYDPGLTAARIAPLFDDLAAFLPEILPQVLEHQAQLGAVRLPAGPFPAAAQQALTRAVLVDLGFDFDRGRLDVSAHPFCGGVMDDVRITTRYDEADPRSALMGVIHEAGHALYERGLPSAWRGQPVGAARGMTMHESQSLLMEMQFARGAPFQAWLGQQMARHLGGEWPAAEMVRAAQHVAPGFIRVDADEVTYPAHVILRFRLERAMVEGRLEVADLPDAWAEGLRDLLGLTPPDHARGCLQDIHWPMGEFGYFPTYTLGALAAAQLFAAARRDLAPAFAGDPIADTLPALLQWLRTHVHQRASSVDTDTLIADATGGHLGTQSFKAHIRQRYLGQG